MYSTGQDRAVLISIPYQGTQLICMERGNETETWKESETNIGQNISSATAIEKDSKAIDIQLDTRDCVSY
jgi:hypothetical protein